MKSLPRVLIVDRSAESREILRTLLERRGAATLEAERPEQALQWTERVRLDLIVLDAESDGSELGHDANRLREAASRNDTPIVILGTLRSERGELPAGQILAKPYHYGPLFHKIDDLLGAA